MRFMQIDFSIALDFLVLMPQITTFTYEGNRTLKQIRTGLKKRRENPLSKKVYLNIGKQLDSIDFNEYSKLV